MSDRLTPLHCFDSPSSADVINLQISGNRVTRRSANIGSLGSLSQVSELGINKPISVDEQSVAESGTARAPGSQGGTLT